MTQSSSRFPLGKRPLLSVAERVGMSPKYQIVPNSEEHIIRFIKVSKPLHSDQKS